MEHTTTFPITTSNDAASFDVCDFEDLMTAEHAVKNPKTQQPTGAVFILAGPENPVRSAIVIDRQQRVRANMAKFGKLVLDSAQEERAFEVELLVASTLGWRNMSEGGKALPFSPDAARRLYSDPRRAWLRDQIKAALDEREAFIGRSASN